LVGRPKYSVADPGHFDIHVDPDPTFHFDTDTAPAAGPYYMYCNSKAHVILPILGTSLVIGIGVVFCYRLRLNLE
jgi:hypothetical protein